MARNTGKEALKGAVKDRSQSYNPTTGQWVKRDSTTGKFIAAKKDGEPFKGIRKEPRTIKISPDIDPKEVRAMIRVLKKIEKTSTSKRS